MALKPRKCNTPAWPMRVETATYEHIYEVRWGLTGVKNAMTSFIKPV